MVRLLVSSVVDRGIEPQPRVKLSNGSCARLECGWSWDLAPAPGQTKNYQISICFFIKE
jgi:hypothetical protein